MRRKTIFLLLAVSFIFGLSCQLYGQNQRSRGFNKANSGNTGSYCLTGIDLTSDQQAKINKMQEKHQAAMTPLRNKLQSTRDWDEKNKIRKEMDALKAKHQEEIWTLVPAARGKSLNLKQGTGRGRGFSGKGQGRRGGQGLGRGYGRNR